MRLKKLVKRFDFSNDERRNVTLGSGVRLAYERQQLELIAINNVYSTAPDLFAKTRLTSPNTCKGWIGFECEAKMKKNGAGAVVTSLGFRLSRDGTAQLWWNGSAWTAADPGEWNTEAEICAHIAAFTGQSIQVIVNLKTSDGAYTPEVQTVKLLWNSDIEFQQEYIARSMIPAMREEILPISEYAVDLTATSTTLDLKKIETPYNIVSIDAVYNLTDDPTKQTDLLASYNTTTKVVTFASVGASKRVLVRFVYAPNIVIIQSQDFKEISKIPAVCIESIFLEKSRQMDPGEHVLNRATGLGWKLKDGFQEDISFTIRYVTDKVADLDALADQVKKFFMDRLLRCRGQDENVRLYTIEEYSHQPSALQSELHSARLRARILDAVFYLKDAVPVQATQRFLVTGGNVEFQV
jgi:hypothetical protein